MRMFRVAAGLAGVIALGCSAPETAPTDAGDIGLDGADEVMAPAPPARPALTPCPVGWREVPGDPPVCDPWPEGGPHACAFDEAHFAGEPTCSRVGTPCPAGEWPEGLPAGSTVLYVRAGGPPGGTGTETDPYGTIGEAMAVSFAGVIVALGRGTFDEPVQLRRGVTLWGACTAETLVTTAIPADMFGTISVGGAGSIVRNLRLSGERPAIVAGRGDVLSIEDVIVEGAQVYGLFVSNTGTVTARNLVVRDTRAAGPGFYVDRYGRGLQVSYGGQLTVERAVIERSREIGVYAGLTGSRVVLRDVVVRDTEPQPRDLESGVGLSVGLGAVLEAERIVLERNRDVAALVTGSTLLLSDAVLRDTTSNARDGTYGRGVHVQMGSTLEMTRVLVERNRDFGVAVGASQATLTDVLVRDTRPLDDGTGGGGMMVRVGGQAHLERVMFDRNRELGFLVADVGSAATIVDLTVRETAGRLSDGWFGYGLEAVDAPMDVTRARIERSRGAGVIIFDAGGPVVLRDLEVLDTIEFECAAGGACVGFGAGIGLGTYRATVDVTRFRIASSALCGVQFARGGTLDLHEGEVSGNPIGVNVQVRGYDLQRLADRVLYRDNARNVETADVSVPEPVVPAGF